jgi:hypothetical protein
MCESKSFKKIEIARRNNQRIYEVMDKLSKFDEKMQKIDKLIPSINVLLLWNENFKKVMEHFEVNFH